MNELDASVFLMVNASAASPVWVTALARAASMELPRALLAGMLVAAFFMNARQRRELVAVLVAVLAAWLGARLIQYAIPLPRPFALGVGTVWLGRAPTAGFPSTHSSVAFAFAVAIGLHSRWAPLSGVALLLAVLVAWSRVCLGLHFPSQVAAGAILGAISAWGCYRTQRIWISRWRQGTSMAYRATPLVGSGALPPGRS